MIILVVLAVSIIVALLRGGRLGNLATLNLRWRGIIILGFLIQVLIFSSFWQNLSETRALTQYGYIASLCLLVAALAANRHIPGMPLITFGFLLNFITIAVNGGYMPASYSAMQSTALAPLLPAQVSSNSIGMGPETRLAFLGDIFAIPRGIPFSNVFSIGDVLIAIGAVYLIQRVLLLSLPRK